MLTYTPVSKRSDDSAREYPWLLLLLVFVWLWPGVFSHDLWKPSEPYLFTAIESVLQQNLRYPILPAAESTHFSPLYVWICAVFVKLLSPWAADAYSAARFSGALFAAIGFTGCGMAGYRLLGKYHGRTTVLLNAGAIGLLPVMHFLNSNAVLFAGAGLLCWALSLSSKQVIFSALIGGIGIFLLGETFHFAALPLWWALCACLWHTTQWRTSRFAVFGFISSLFALPLLSLYPLLLLYFSSDTAAHYFGHRMFGIFGGLRNFQAAFSLPYFVKNFLWFAFPVWPLALWSGHRSRKQLSRTGTLVYAWLAVFCTVLAVSPERNKDILVLLLPVLSLSASAQLFHLRRGVAAFFNWFGMTLFGFAALFLWLGFFAMNYGFPAKLAERAAYFSPYYVRDIDIMPIVTATLFTPVWLLAVTRKRIRGRQAVTNWTAGVTLVWALMMTLFLPWLDAAKSYRPVVRQMERTLPENVRRSLMTGKECLFIDPNHTDAHLAWSQYARIPFVSADLSCRYVLLQYNPKTEELPNYAATLWQGGRPRHRRERFALLEKSP